MLTKRRIRIKDNESLRKILLEVEKKTNDSIFQSDNFQKLGKVYFNIFCSLVKNRKKEVVNIFKNLAKRFGKNINDSKELYEFICYFYRFKRLPKKVLESVKEEYDKTFSMKYEHAKGLYIKALGNINKENTAIQVKINAIGSKKNRFNFDPSEDVNLIKSCFRQTNFLRTKKEIFENSFKFLENKMDEFGDTTNNIEIIKTLKEVALKYSTDNFDIALEFSSYNSYLDAFIYSIEQYDNLFFDNKFFPLFELIKSETNIFHDDKNEIERFRKKEKALLAERDLLISNSQKDDDKYAVMLENFVNDHLIVESTKKLIEVLACISNRKNLLNKALIFFNNQEFELFNNIVPIQIEGIFNDLIQDLQIIDKLSSQKGSYSMDLKTKAQNLSNHIPFEYVRYYGYYFNNIIRNIVAHGRLNLGDDSKILEKIMSMELLLDLYSILYMVSRYSNIEIMCQYVNHFFDTAVFFPKDKRNHSFNILCNDLIGARTHIFYDKIEHYTPHEIIMWILNPYYEKLYYYKVSAANTNLKDLRELLMSRDFWGFFKAEIKGYKENNELDFMIKNPKELISALKNLLKCGLPKDVKLIILDILKIIEIEGK